MRKYFITGLLVILPISLTLYIMIRLFGFLASISSFIIPTTFLDDQTAGYIYRFLLSILGYVVSISTTIGLIAFIGALALNYFGKLIFDNIELIITKIPFSSSIYSTIKQISEILIKDGSAYKKVVIIEAVKGFKSIGFVTNEQLSLIIDGNKDSYITIFVPTAPNPTSGFLVITKKENIKILDISVENAAKLIISAGSVTK